VPTFSSLSLRLAFRLVLSIDRLLDYSFIDSDYER
jgi:hypothetical protein